MKTYSQSNEQAFILEYFRMTGLIVEGRHRTFLDLGANDGSTFSNTRALALMGWNGVCVDASPCAFAKLRILYGSNPNIECHNVAMGTRNGTITLHESGEHIGNGDRGLLSTTIPSEMERWKGTETFTPTEVEQITFAELIQRSEFSTFDLISMDIEGAEWDVLQQIDLDAVGCRMLIVEVNDRDPKPYIKYAASFGMKLITRNAENLILQR